MKKENGDEWLRQGRSATGLQAEGAIHLVKQVATK